jgi:hypothetical protein
MVGASYQVIVPELHGSGTTHFISDELLRDGQQSAFAIRVAGLMDGLPMDAQPYHRSVGSTLYKSTSSGRQVQPLTLVYGRSPPGDSSLCHLPFLSS